jgi:choline dehydrogenase-like flavoprotein
LFSSDRVVAYQTTPQLGAGSRAFFVPQANTLGGGSSVNAMIYIRGSAEDYDEWKALGCDGWGWDDVLPVFKKSEGNDTLSGPYHGVDGPMKVSNPWYGIPTNLAFLKAGQEIGLRFNPDFNGQSQEGVGFYQSTCSKGRRSSAATSHLAPQRKRPNLTVRTNCTVLRLITEGSRVTGVVYREKDGSKHEQRAGREVILAAGAFASPKILQLSGIGPASLLKDKGVPVVYDAPEVGENFQNHVEVPLHCRLKEPVSLLGQDRGFAALKHGLQYVLFRSGLLASSIAEAGAFIDTENTGRPDVQLYLIPSLFGSPEWPAPPGHGVSICVQLLRPKSRGSVKLKSADPDDPLVFDAGVLAHRDDVGTISRGIDVARRMMKAPSLSQIVSGEIYSAPEGEDDARNPEGFVRKYARQVSHVAGTCRMGSDAGAVVDTKLRVNGLSGLRIGDASIMPKLISGNTNAVSTLIGERCAEFVLRSHN